MRRLTEVVGLRGGSSLGAIQLSSIGLKNVCVENSCDDFTFIAGKRHHRVPFVIAQFLSPLVCEIRFVDRTINAIQINVDDRNECFARFLDLARGGSISVDPADRATFTSICTALGSTELSECTSGEITISNAVDCLLVLSQARRDISRALEFISSHFYDLSHQRDALK
jgi:hypothetical protein